MTQRGIREVFLIPRGLGASFAAGNAVEGVVSLGKRKAGTLTISGFDEGETIDKNKTRNKMGYKFVSDTFQCDLDTLFYIRWFCYAGGADVILMSEGTKLDGGNYSSPQGIFYFFDSSSAKQSLGVDFKFTLSKERTCQLTLEKAYDWEEGKAIKAAAKTNWPKLPAGYSVPNISMSKVIKPKLNSLYFNNTLLCDKEDVIERSLTIESKSLKTMYNRSYDPVYLVNFDLTLPDASIDKMLSLDNTDQFAPLKIIEDVAIGQTEEYIFQQNAFSHTDNVDFGDEKAENKLSWSGEFTTSRFDIKAASWPKQMIFSA